MYCDVCWLPISQLFVVPSRASISAWRCAGPRQSQHILGVAAVQSTIVGTVPGLFLGESKETRFWAFVHVIAA